MFQEFQEKLERRRPGVLECGLSEWRLPAADGEESRHELLPDFLCYAC